MSATSFRVPGDVPPKGSTHAFVNPHSGRIQVWQNQRKRLKDFNQRVRLAARAAGVRRSACPLAVDLTFRLPRPAQDLGTGRNAGRPRPSAPQFPDVKPDVDKLIRAALDALSGVAWVDDAQVVEVAAAKHYATEPHGVGLEVQIEELGEARRSRIEQLDRLDNPNLKRRNACLRGH